MPDELDKLRRLFSDGNDETKKASPDEADVESPSDAFDDKLLGEIWGRADREDLPEEEDVDKPSPDIDEGRREEPAPEDYVRPFIPPKDERPDASAVMEKMAIEHLRRQKQDLERETKVEGSLEKAKDDEDGVPPWALGVNTDKPVKSELEEPYENTCADACDDEPEEPSPEPSKSWERIRSVNDLGDAAKKSMLPNDEEIEQSADDVGQLRDILFSRSDDDGASKPKRKKPVYREPTPEINPLVSFIGLIGAICLGLVLLMSLFGAKAGVGLVGLSGAGLLMVIIYIITNRRNLKIVLSARSTRYGTNVIIVILSLLGMLIVVNAIGYQHYIVFDTTAAKIHTLSDQTLQVLKQYRESGQEIQAIVFIPREPQFREYRDIFEDRLAKYQYHVPKLNIDYLDPDVSRQRAGELGFEDRVGVVFEAGEKHEKAVEFTTKSPLSFEVAMTGALLRLGGTHTRQVYFLTGHYELSSDDYTQQNAHSAGLFAQALELSGYKISQLSFSTKAQVPVDCSLLIIAGPEKELTEEEIGAIKAYIEQGGRAVILLEARNSAGFAPLLESYGIYFRSDLIADETNNLLGSNNLYPVLDLNEHPITAPLKRKGMDVVFFRASGLDVDSKRPSGEFIERLLSTKAGGGSWSESGEEEDALMDPEEERGPFTMAVLAGKEIEAETPADEAEAVEGDKAESKGDRKNWGLILVAGDASFIANPYLSTYGNKDFILNTVDYMASDKTDLTIRPKESAPLLALTKSQGGFVFLVSVVFIPLLVAAFGVTVWLRRK